MMQKIMPNFHTSPLSGMFEILVHENIILNLSLWLR